MSGFTSEFLDKPDKGSFVVFHPGHTHTHTQISHVDEMNLHEENTKMVRTTSELKGISLLSSPRSR